MKYLLTISFSAFLFVVSNNSLAHHINHGNLKGKKSFIEEIVPGTVVTTPKRGTAHNPNNKSTDLHDGRYPYSANSDCDPTNYSSGDEICLEEFKR